MAEKDDVLYYKDRPLVRSGKVLYYGDMGDRFVVMMQVLTSKKEGDTELPDKVQVCLMNTDDTLPFPDRILNNATKTGLWAALDIGAVWLERALSE